MPLKLKIRFTNEQSIMYVFASRNQTMKFFFCCLFLGVTAVSIATKFKDCGSTIVTVTSVEIEGCPDGEDRCLLKQDATKDITIKFDAIKGTSGLIEVSSFVSNTNATNNSEKLK